MLSRKDYFQLHGEPIGDTRMLMLDNTDELLIRVNSLLDLAKLDGVEPGVDQISGTAVASGYRPAGVNAKTSNAAAASTHLTCEGIDLQDRISTRLLAVWCCQNIDVLERLKLWMEDPRWTGGRTNTDPWVHLQSRPPRSGKRIYVPSMAPAQDPNFYIRNALKAP